MNEKPPIKSYCGGKPNYCTPEVTHEVTGEVTGDVDVVNISQDCVDETAKGEHEPLYMDMSQVPTGMPDWKPGMVFQAPKREWVGLTDEDKHYLNEVLNLQGRFPVIDAIEAKLREKNCG